MVDVNDEMMMRRNRAKAREGVAGFFVVVALIGTIGIAQAKLTQSARTRSPEVIARIVRSASEPHPSDRAARTLQAWLGPRQVDRFDSKILAIQPFGSKVDVNIDLHLRDGTRVQGVITTDGARGTSFVPH